MLKTSSLSLEEFVFASRTRKRGAGKQRDVVDAFRTVYWFHHLRRALDSPSVYQMDVLAEGPAVARGEPSRGRKTRWRSYSKGRHSPSAPLVAELGLAHPGSIAAFQHPLWDTLGESQLRPPPAFVLGRLDASVLAIVRKGFSASPDMRLFPGHWNATRMQMLERRASLDALAGLMLVLNAAVAEGLDVVASIASLRICRVLLMLGPWFHEHGVARPLAEYVEQLVLPKGSRNGHHFAFSAEGFSKCSAQLWRLLKIATANSNRRFSSAEVASLLTLLLNRHAVDKWIVRMGVT